MKNIRTITHSSYKEEEPTQQEKKKMKEKHESEDG